MLTNDTWQGIFDEEPPFELRPVGWAIMDKLSYKASFNVRRLISASFRSEYYLEEVLHKAKDQLLHAARQRFEDDRERRGIGV